MLMMFRNF